MRCLIACEFSGIVRDAFRECGHDAWSCDLLPTEGDPQWHIQGDVLEILDDGWDLMIAHPPCTYLTVTGNKWFKPEYKTRFPDREKQREEAVEFFMRFATADIPKICIENPSGIMSTRWRPPDQTICPSYFGHKEQKRTCLWLKNLPALLWRPCDDLFGKQTECAEKEERYKMKSGKTMPRWYALLKADGNRSHIRSRTFPGIARAMAIQWSCI